MLVGAEYGCCGINGMLMSFIAYDDGKGLKADSFAAKLRRSMNWVWSALLVPIIVAICISINITTRNDIEVYQASSILVLYPCLMLNIWFSLLMVAALFKT